MVAPNSPERRSRGGRVYRLDLHARLPHAPPEGTRHVQATEPVVEYPHAHALLSLCRQRVGEPVSDFVVLEDVVVEVNPTLRPRDGREPVVVCVRAVLQQRDLVPLTQWRVTDSSQDSFQTSAA